MTRRRPHRVDSRDLPVIVRVHTRAQSTFPVRVVELSIRRAVIRIPAEEEPLAVGQVVQLEVLPPGKEGLRVAARVVALEDGAHPAGAHPASAHPADYHLSFVYPAGIEARLTPALARLFNRRRVPRLRVMGLQVVLAAADARWAVGAVDLSEDGIGLEVDQVVPPFTTDGHVEVRLRLPDLPDLRIFGTFLTRVDLLGRRRLVVLLRAIEANREARELVQRYVRERIS